MPDRTIKRRLQDCDVALASDDGPIFSTVAKLVDALKRSVPEGTENAERKKEALGLASELLRVFGPERRCLVTGPRGDQLRDDEDPLPRQHRVS